jgi:hypothetical protein
MATFTLGNGQNTSIALNSIPRTRLLAFVISPLMFASIAHFLPFILLSFRFVDFAGSSSKLTHSVYNSTNSSVSQTLAVRSDGLLNGQTSDKPSR